MNVTQLYIDYNIEFKTEGHKHCRPNWVNMPCPFCQGNFGYHLGYNEIENYYYCWRCGYHSTIETVSEILHISKKETYIVIKQYDAIISSKKVIVKIKKNPFKFPSNCEALSANHKKYLEKRNFDSVELEKLWNLKGTGVYSKLDDIDYKHRIIAPFYWNNEVVTFQGRDITNKHPLKYMACPEARETIHHKHILYGNQKEWSDTGICVEGITDVWRLGIKAFATLGIKYTSKQMRLIAKTFKRVAVIFDDESQAIKQANKLVADLQFRNVDAFRIDIKGDPGSMKDDDVKHLLNQIF